MPPLLLTLKLLHFLIFSELPPTFAIKWSSLIVQLVKNPSAMQKTLVRFLGWEDPLKKGKATHSSILAWRISWAV